MRIYHRRHPHRPSSRRLRQDPSHAAGRLRTLRIRRVPDAFRTIVYPIPREASSSRAGTPGAATEETLNSWVAAAGATPDGYPLDWARWEEDCPETRVVTAAAKNVKGLRSSRVLEARSPTAPLVHVRPPPRPWDDTNESEDGAGAFVPVVVDAYDTAWGANPRFVSATDMAYDNPLDPFSAVRSAPDQSSTAAAPAIDEPCRRPALVAATALSGGAAKTAGPRPMTRSWPTWHRSTVPSRTFTHNVGGLHLGRGAFHISAMKCHGGVF